jgi:transcriptional regulator with XRE-family HTH domain
MSAKTPDPVDIAVGHRIRVERLSRGMSQTVLADQLGVTFQQVQKYEKGVNRVGAGRLTKIAEALGVPVSTFFTDQHMLNNGSGTANDDEAAGRSWRVAFAALLCGHRRLECERFSCGSC